MKIVAIVPMRHVSERVQGKNYRLFAGKPLYHHVVSTLLSCKEISDVVIDTDSDIIMKDANSAFPSVILHRRPDHLRNNTTPMNEVLLNAVTKIDADIYVQTHSTNPLLRSSTLSNAIDSFSAQAGTYDSLFSVTRLQTRLWNSESGPLNHDPTVLLRTQDLEPVFEENSCMYIFTKTSLQKYGNRIGAHPIMFEIDKLESQDIDNEEDFTLAEALLKNSEHES